MPYATLSDVEIDYGPIGADDVDKVETLLERAEARIRQVYPDLDERITDGKTSVVLVKQVESEMVAGVLRNPGGVRSITESVGPFSRSTGYGSNSAANDPTFGLLELSKRQRAMLGGTSDAAGSFGPYLQVPAPSEYWTPALLERDFRENEGWLG